MFLSPVCGRSPLPEAYDIQNEITPLLNSVLTNKQTNAFTVNSRLADISLLPTPRQYGQLLNASAKISNIWPKQTPAITNSGDYGLTDTSLGPDGTILLFLLSLTDIIQHLGQHLVELSQIIIYFFLFLCSSLSLWLKSEHSDSCLTWYFHETAVFTCKKQSGCT